MRDSSSGLEALREANGSRITRDPARDATPELQTTVFRFGPFELDLGLRELRSHGHRHSIQRKPMEVLRYLISERHRVVPKRELLAALWPDSTVSELSLTSAIRDVRRAIRQKGDPSSMLQTVRGHGYRFVAEVEELASPGVEGQRSAHGLADLSDSMLGRSTFLKRLRLALDAAAKGDTHVAVVRGAPGIGKTRLAFALASEAQQLGVHVRVGTFAPGVAAPPLWAWTQLLRDCETQRDPVVTRHFSSPTPADLERLRAQLIRCAHARRQVWILEDVHWADEDSLALLQGSIHWLDGAPVLLVVTLRDEGVDSVALRQTCAMLARHSGYDELALIGLDRALVDALIARRVPEGTAEATLRDIFELSEGNPLLATELAHSLHATLGPDSGSSADPGSEAWREPADAPMPRTPLPIPARIRDLIELQLSFRSEACASMLRRAAAIGAEFELDLLRRVMDSSREHLLDAVSEAERCGLLRELPHRSGTYQFKRRVWRECLYQSLAKADVRRLHLRIAEAIEASAHADPDAHLDALTHHLLEAAAAGAASKAVRYARRAAEKAACGSDFREASMYCDRALQALVHDATARAGDHAELHVLRAEYLLATGASRSERTNRQIELSYATATRLARTADCPRLFARAAMGRARYALEAHLFLPYVPAHLIERTAPWESLLQEALGRLESSGNDDLRAQLLAHLATLHSWLGDASRGVEEIIRAHAIAQELDDRALQAEITAIELYLRRDPDESPLRLDLARRVEQLGARLGSAYWLHLGRHFREVELVTLGIVEPIDATDLELAPGTAHPTRSVFPSPIKIMYALLHGDLERAESLLQQLQRDGEGLAHGSLLLGGSAVQLVWLRLHQGRAEEVIDSVEAWARQLSGLPIVRLLLGRLLCELGRIEEAQRELVRAFRPDFSDVPRDRSWLATLVLASELAMATRDGERASCLYEMLAPYHGHVALLTNGVLCLGSVERALGLDAWAMGRRELAHRHLEHALERHERLGAEPLAILDLRELAKLEQECDMGAPSPRATALSKAASERAKRVGLHLAGHAPRAEWSTAELAARSPELMR